MKILLIEDIAEDAQQIREALAAVQGYALELTTVDRLSSGLQHLSGHAVDLVLLDLKLPDSEGLKTLIQVRGRAPRVPIVVLTASDDTAIAVEAVQRGAKDYLVKGYVQVYPSLLERAIRYAVERQRAEDAVRIAHAQTEQLLSSILSILIRLGPTGVVTYWNSVAERTFGIAAQAALGRPLSDCGVRWDSERVQACLGECRRTNRPVSLDEVFYTRVDGQHGCAGITVVPMRGADQGLDILLIGADVTERKQAEAERARLQRQLLQAQKMDTIGRFAGGIAHDFKNFLQVILSFAWLIRSHRQDDRELMESLQEIVHAAESGSHLVQQLLAFSQKQPLQPTVFELNQAVRGMHKLLQQFVGEDVQVHLELMPSPLRVRMDATGLEQILMNLCANARDSMPRGGTLTIRTSRRLIDEAFLDAHPEATRGDYVGLSIQDSGTGMDPGVGAHLFEPFFTTKHLGEGTGLGLAVIYRLVQQHGGCIDIDTAPGHGTTFHLYFPCQDGQVGG